MWILCLGLLALGLGCYAQQPAAAPQQPGDGQELVIRTETRLVLLPFLVQRKGKYVAGLGEQDVELLEDGVPRKVALFDGPSGNAQQARRVPVEIMLVLDVSLSVMNTDLLDFASLRDTVLGGLGEHVGISIYAFGGKMKRFAHNTRDPEVLTKALDQSYAFAHGGSRIYEAIMSAAKEASQGEAGVQRLMLVFSDGFSTTQTPPQHASAVASAYGIPVYPVVLGHDRVLQQSRGGPGSNINRPIDPRNQPTFGNAPIPGAAARDRRVAGGTHGQIDQQMRTGRARELESIMAQFAAIGDQTGGQSFDLKQANNQLIRGVLKALAEQVQAEYVAGYYPAGASGEKRARRVEIRLKDPKKGKLYGGRRAVVY